MTSSSPSSSSDEETTMLASDEDPDTAKCMHALEAIVEEDDNNIEEGNSGNREEESEEEELNPLKAALEAISQLAKEADLQNLEPYRRSSNERSLTRSGVSKKFSMDNEEEHVLGSRKSSSVDNTFGAADKDLEKDEERERERRLARIRAKLLHSSLDVQDNEAKEQQLTINEGSNKTFNKDYNDLSGSRKSSSASLPKSSYLVRSTNGNRPSWDPAAGFEADQNQVEHQTDSGLRPHVHEQSEDEPPTPPPRKSRFWPFRFGDKNNNNLDVSANNSKNNNYTMESDVKLDVMGEEKEGQKGNSQIHDIQDVSKETNNRRFDSLSKWNEHESEQKQFNENDSSELEASEMVAGKHEDSNEYERNERSDEMEEVRDDDERLRSINDYNRSKSSDRSPYDGHRESASHERIIEASEDALQSDLLWPCPTCNRTFFRAALERHVTICRRVSSKKRPLFGNSRSTPTTPASSPSISRRKKSSAIEDELQVCPTCERKFNFKAFDKHVQWCSEKHRRLMQSPNKDTQALAKLHARTHYRPSSNQDNGLRKLSSTQSLVSAVSPTPSRCSMYSSHDISSRMSNNHTKESEQTHLIRAATGRGSIRRGPAPTKASQLRQMAKERESGGESGIARQSSVTPTGLTGRGLMSSGSFRRISGSPTPKLMSSSYHAGDGGEWRRQLSNLSHSSIESPMMRSRVLKRIEPEGIDDDANDQLHLMDADNDNSLVIEPYDHSQEYDPYKSAAQQMQELLFGTKTSSSRPAVSSKTSMVRDGSSMKPSSNSAFEKYVPTTADINSKLGSFLSPTNSLATTKSAVLTKPGTKTLVGSEIERPTSTRVARFCHECGSAFALPTIRFCCECGVKRLHC